jgi:hypothetical protein
VEEVVAFLAGDLEVHEAETVSREDRLLTFGADDRFPEFHGLLLALVFSGCTDNPLRSICSFPIGFRQTSSFSVAIGPYLKYRKWREKDDNDYERLEEVERPWLLSS